MNRDFVKSELNKLGVEIAEDKAKAFIDAIMQQNGEDINEKNDLQKQLETANSTIKDLQKTIDENGNNAEALKNAQAKIKEYEDNEKIRKDQEDKAKADAEFNAKITSIFDELGVKSHSYIRSGLTADARAKLEADNTLGLKDIVADLIKDNDEFKVNPNANVVIPGAGAGGNTGNDAEAIAKARAVMGLPKGKDEN